MPRARSVAAAFVVLLAVLSVMRAEAQTDPGEAPATSNTSSAHLTLLDQSPWVGPDGNFDLRLRVDGAPAGSQISLQVYRAITSRTAFAQSVDGQNVGSALRPLPPVLPLDALPRATDGSIQLSYPVSTTNPSPLGIRVDGQGVFPVLVSLVDGNDDELDRFVTHLIRLPTTDTAARPLAFSLVVPFAAGPGYAPDGQARVSEADAGRLDAAARALTTNPSVPLSLDPVPETVESLADSGDAGASTTTSLARSLTGRQVLGDSYVPLDLGSWVATTDPTAADELSRQATTGNDVLAAKLGTRPDRRTTVVNRRFTPEALTHLSEVGVDQLVIPEDQLGPLSGQAAQVTFTQKFDVLNSEGRAMRSVMADAALADRLTATDDAVLNAHLVIADLAVLFFDRPNTARGAVLVVPDDLSVPQATYDALLSSLSRPSIDAGIAAGGHQIVAPMTLDDLFDATSAAPGNSRASALVRPYTADAPAGLGPLLDQVRATRSRISSYASIVGSGADRATTRIALLDRQVLIAESAGLDDATRKAYFDGVGAAIDGQLQSIITPADQRVTLTARSGDVPITIENRLDYPVDVKVVLTSAKVEFPDGNVRTVTLPPGTPTQVDVAIEAKASGAFPLDVVVQSPDGSTTLGTARYTVRSTAISGVGLFLSIGAGLFLLLWWARHFRTVRRDRRLVSTSHPSMRAAPRVVDDEPTTTPR
jgi:hypothetical protein